MLRILIVNISEAIDQVLQRSDGITMGMNCYSFIRGGIYLKSKASTWEKNLAVAFNLTFRYIEDVSFIINDKLHSYVNLIYPKWTWN
jgi:hypothetical protein